MSSGRWCGLFSAVGIITAAGVGIAIGAKKAAEYAATETHDFVSKALAGQFNVSSFMQSIGVTMESADVMTPFGKHIGLNTLHDINQFPQIASDAAYKATIVTSVVVVIAVTALAVSVAHCCRKNDNRNANGYEQAAEDDLESGRTAKATQPSRG